MNRTMWTVASVLACAAIAVAGGPYGLADRPPLGWRSWNAYHGNINQQTMESIMDKLVQRNRSVDGVPTSLADIGYTVAGLDDNWQACGAGVNGTFHDADGHQLVNKQRFPDMKGMVDYAHGKGLKAGFYANNCICKETNQMNETWVAAVYRSSVVDMVDWGFDGVKLDGCSQFHNTSHWSALMNASGRPMLVENCHNTNQPQSIDDWGGKCPYNWFRSSSDINPSWGSIFGNLQTTRKYQGYPPLSRPGCWAYPDMLEVGNMASFEEDRSHFGAWCVVSSPLILGYDLAKEDVTDKVWDIITNKEAIAVNQQYAGHPGKWVKDYNSAAPSPPASLGLNVFAVKCVDGDSTAVGWSYDASTGVIKGPGANLCLDASEANRAVLKPCVPGSPTQQFAFNGTAATPQPIRPKSSMDNCLDVWAGAGPPGGPAVQWYHCHNGPNERFFFQLEKGGRLLENGGQCLVARENGPSPDSGKIQLWAKPQPRGALAVFLLSNQDVTATNASVVVDLVNDLNMTGPVKIRDVWNHQDLGTHSGTFATDAFGYHDSRFYVVSPA